MSEFQLNFINYFEKTEKALKDSIEETCGILERSLGLIPTYQPMRKVVAIELRLLLADRENSLIPKVFKDFKLPPLIDDYINIHEDLYCINVNKINDMFDYTKEEINLRQWLRQKIYYFDRDIDSLPSKIDDLFFNQILDKLSRGNHKRDYIYFNQCFYSNKSTGRYEEKEIYHFLKEEMNNNDKQKLLELLNRIGYNSIDIFTLIKLVANKEGAHSDSNTPIGLLFAHIDDERITYLDVIALTILKQIQKYLDNSN
ncbi:hypothetical protein ACTFIN_08375 [Clostridium cagae]|uniref:hypothetical protein n=1 Tax=Clostridium cagae TaxID=2080751 RepID=UPI003F759D5A